MREFNDYFDGEGFVSFRRFHGGKARHIKQYLATHLEEVAPKTVVIQTGGNDLPTPRQNPMPVETIAQDIIESGEICKYYGVENVLISGVPTRSKSYIQTRCHDLNNILQEMCKQNGFTYIDNTNIDLTHLQEDGVHLTNEGSNTLANNYLFYLNSLYWDRVLLNQVHD